MTSHHQVNFKKCKCCNSTTTSFQYIYDDEGKDLNIEFLLFDCVGKKVYERNGFNQVVCNNCLSQLQQTYEFKIKCREAANDSENSENEDYEVVSTYSTCVADREEQNSDIQVEKLIAELDETGAELGYEMISSENNQEDDSNGETKFQFDEAIDIIEDTTLDNTAQDVNDKLSTSLTVPTVKKKLSKNVPSHHIKIKSEILVSRTIDVEKIRTSDDLIHILEDDYQSESDSNRKRLTDNTDEFNIPKIEVQDFCDNIEYLDESKPIDLDEYIKKVTLIRYDEKKCFISDVKCVMCNNDVTLKTFSAIVKHMYQEHHEDNFNQFACLINSKCGLFGHLDDLKNHYATEHQEIVTPSLKLKCATCDTIFDSAIKFGKHICYDDYQVSGTETDFKCSLCRRQLASRKRFIFHKQFHLPNQRPKFCLVCQTKYEDENSFYEHVMFAHEQVFEHFCSQCDRSFSTDIDLTRHENTHTAQRNYICPECGKKFIDRQTWNEHSVVHLANKPLKCDVCNKSYTRKSRLQKHMKSHTVFETSLLTNCEMCNSVFVDDDQAMEHYKKFHETGDSVEILLGYETYDKVFVCEFCEMAFGTTEEVLAHRESHTGTVKFECSFCESRYDTYSKKRTHLLIHKDQIRPFPVERHYLCDQDNCFKSYIHWSSLTAHRKTSHLINPSIIKCADCPETFYRSWTYDYHKKTVHGECESCPICDKGFYKKKSLELHMQRVHINDRKQSSSNIDLAEKLIIVNGGVITCRECGKVCPSKYNAISHISMVHLKVRNFVCDVCDKGFFQKGDLNDHYRLHTKEKPFNCRYCAYSSRKKSMVVTHERAHTNERPFQCPRCPCAFKRSYVLKNHLKYHDGVKEFQCPIVTCNKMFTTNAALNFHCKFKHVDGGLMNGSVSTKLTKLKKVRVPANVSIRKIPKIVYVMPGKQDSEEGPQPKKSKNEKSRIEIQSVSSIPFYIDDN